MENKIFYFQNITDFNLKKVSASINDNSYQLGGTGSVVIGAPNIS